MNQQPEALRLADLLEQQFPIGTAQNFLDEEAAALVAAAERERCAAELRRLHALNQYLLEALQFCAGTSYISDAHEIAEDAIAKAEGSR